MLIGTALMTDVTSFIVSDQFNRLQPAFRYFKEVVVTFRKCTQFCYKKTKNKNVSPFTYWLLL